MRERPVPSWMPLIMGVGMMWVKRWIRPVALRRVRQAATKSPADAVSARVKFWAMATAAIAFMGWTGRGRPKVRPVRMLARPENTRVLERKMLLVWVRAMRRGRRVPMSPKEPEISVKG